MHARTRLHRPELVPELGLVTWKGRRDKGERRKEKPRYHVISREGEGNTMSFSLESPNERTQTERNSNPFDLRSEKSQETQRNSMGGVATVTSPLNNLSNFHF